MKKVFTGFAVFIIALVLLTVYCFGEDSSKLFYDGGVYTLGNPVLSIDGECFVAADDLVKVLGFRYWTDDTFAAVFIQYKDSIAVYKIDRSESSDALSNGNPGHDAPQYINGNLYLPAAFIESEFKLFVKYTTSGATYLLSSESVDASQLSIFKNVTYDYSVPVISNVDISLDQSESAFNDNTIFINDKNNLFSASITCDRLDTNTMAKMRDYLNDKTSTDEIIFDKFVSFKESYFNAIQEYYRNQFLYGENENGFKETNMKTFGVYNEKVFGQDSRIVLYNTLKSDKSSSNEEIHIEFTVPVHESMTIYSIHFTLKKGYLEQNTIARMSEIVNGIHIANLPEQVDSPGIFKDTKALYAANSGIYSSPGNRESDFIDYTDNAAGYTIAYPSSFIPYSENNITDSMSYKSFKIDTKTGLAVIVEPVPGTDAIKDKLDFIKEYYKDEISPIKSDFLVSDNMVFFVADYELSLKNGTQYMRDYYIMHNSRLYDIKLVSSGIKPSKAIDEAVLKVVKSLKFLQIPAVDYKSLSSVKYSDNQAGLTFKYPKQWKVTEEKKGEGKYPVYAVKNPDYTGTFEIYASEGVIDQDTSLSQVFKALSGINSSVPKYYWSPYTGKNASLLTFDIKKSDNETCFYRLVSYLDSDGRGKLGYAEDIIKDGKIYSLFIIVSDYAAADGRILDENAGKALNLIASSFGIEQPQGYLSMLMNPAASVNLKSAAVICSEANGIDMPMEVSSPD